MWHCNLKRGLINWGQADQVERGMVILLWTSKILDKENIGDWKDRQLGSIRGHLTVYKNFQWGNTLFELYKVFGLEDLIINSLIFPDKENIYKLELRKRIKHEGEAIWIDFDYRIWLHLKSLSGWPDRKNSIV